jgi:hypothetical protein
MAAVALTLPLNVQSDIASYLPCFGFLACVHRSWNASVNALKQCLLETFNSSVFSVKSLGDLNTSDDNMKERLTRLCNLNLGLSLAEMKDDTLFWYTAQLYLHRFCQKNAATFEDIRTRCFAYSPIGDYSYKDFFGDSPCSTPIQAFFFHSVGYVKARDLGCSHIGCSVREVLDTLQCMIGRRTYCGLFCHCLEDNA